MTSILKGVSDKIWIKTTAKVRQDKGRHIDVPFEVQCLVPSTSRIRELRKEISDDANELTDAQLAQEFIVDWDMPGADGNKVEFNEQNMDIVLDHPDYIGAIANALTELLFGKEALKAKNSMARGERGRAAR